MSQPDWPIAGVWKGVTCFAAPVLSSGSDGCGPCDGCSFDHSADCIDSDVEGSGFEDCAGRKVVFVRNTPEDIANYIAARMNK